MLSSAFIDGFRETCFRRGIDPQEAAILEKRAEDAFHTVQDGEILGRIANRYKTTPQAIAKANGFKTVNDVIRPGQRLKLPAVPAAKPQAPAATSAPAGERNHVVADNEILGRIANRYGVTPQAIAELNGFKTVNDVIRPGQKLRIPAARPKPQPAPVAAPPAAPAAPAVPAPAPVPGGVPIKPMKYHGLAANNPGNLRVSSIPWRGKVDVPGAQFLTFDSPTNGVRAAARLAYNYRKRYGIDTLRGLANKWAPSNENDTSKYVTDLANQTGWGADQKVDFRNEANLRKLLPAIFHNEVGETGYDPAMISNAVHDAVSTLAKR